VAKQQKILIIFFAGTTDIQKWKLPQIRKNKGRGIGVDSSSRQIRRI